MLKEQEYGEDSPRILVGTGVPKLYGGNPNIYGVYSFSLSGEIMSSDHVSKTKLLTVATMMCVISTIFQCATFFLTEFFIFITMFSILPIYIISKMNLRYGVISVVVTFLIVCMVTVHEACIFLFTNGLIGINILGVSSISAGKLVGIMLGISLVVAVLMLFIFKYINKAFHMLMNRIKKN